MIQKLQSRGVRFLAPETVYVAPEVVPERVAPGVTVHPGCRLGGAEFSAGPGCVIGAEAPATVLDCQLGADVQLAGGFFERSTFLDGFKAGSGAHVRPGCLFEEGSSIAHSVGVKQTVFLPWVAAGSLINFCDALMAGGTGRKDHSEIGSSYIHFNFTPHQDKATASLVGDVPRGVLLNQPPVFLGGQGGLVGPVVIEYGTVIPAGQVWRGDVTEPGRLVAKPAFRGAVDTPYDPKRFGSVRRVVRNNLRYIGNIAALDAWYRAVRARFMCADAVGPQSSAASADGGRGLPPYQAACHAGARKRLAEILEERLARLDELARKVGETFNVQRSTLNVQRSTGDGDNHAFVARWPAMKEALEAFAQGRETGAAASPPPGDALPRPEAGPYLKAVQALPAESGRALTAWLEGIVNQAVRLGTP
jgi:UDP-N-acetylglucosamine/UDP-N-acetylgalactosamine diphosphorylase